MSEEDTEVSLPPSKSQRKREAHALQSMGKQLIELNDSDLVNLPVSDELRSAVQEYNRLPNSHEARRRQLQFIGRLMRDCNADELEQALNNNQNPPQPESTQASAAEQWRDRILAEGDVAIEDLIQLAEHAERQNLRQLYRNINKASGTGQKQQLNKLLRYLESLNLPSE
ncbi:MAG: ribosome biogenesis factor YjgA [Gammaproteobacteria bacterium]